VLVLVPTLQDGLLVLFLACLAAMQQGPACCLAVLVRFGQLRGCLQGVLSSAMGAAGSAAPAGTHSAGFACRKLLQEEQGAA
jgi:hypothetical protein